MTGALPEARPAAENVATPVPEPDDAPAGQQEGAVDGEQLEVVAERAEGATDDVGDDEPLAGCRGAEAERRGAGDHAGGGGEGGGRAVESGRTRGADAELERAAGGDDAGGGQLNVTGASRVTPLAVRASCSSP